MVCLKYIVNVISPDTIIEPWWRTYAKALVFVSPAVMAWGFACIYLVPKAREICRVAGLDPSGLGWLWPAISFSVQWGPSILVTAIVTLILLEVVAPGWRRRRRLTVSSITWLANVAVLFGLIMLLIVVLIAAPGLAHPQ